MSKVLKIVPKLIRSKNPKTNSFQKSPKIFGKNPCSPIRFPEKLYPAHLNQHARLIEIIKFWLTSDYLLSPCGILISLINKYVGLIKCSKKIQVGLETLVYYIKSMGFFLKNNERVYEFMSEKKIQVIWNFLLLSSIHIYLNNLIGMN